MTLKIISVYIKFILDHAYKQSDLNSNIPCIFDESVHENLEISDDNPSKISFLDFTSLVNQVCFIS